ncbi:lipopolysaccharide biosynthesis protein [Mucilaginibacter phyllosphaerae]|uniref:O-antigen/teichoic acid export membrane protein n=1 Tax=Mucilaginibacter phyllosphaerae TaxID=1812349 RepID=A0A4Y8AG33_9SPHI|nr:oligosaccharide flippase family protein [Mucilaginibacter phyllosphaerae]MBB3968634.1 O-antigen/teichoic acid export membrane protein [Mucilaginibacter phyllosphaerae]TEW67728.1 hypothetical protein E2R65_07000 [Mucilaginibacter phyllosphaerae]GGH14800.1 hypothetical protein GCM10007352_23150 [Mucilaginibacter phyllosphaerae]
MLAKFKDNNFFKTMLHYAASQLVGNMFRLISGFLTVRLIEPQIYGIFTGYGVYLGYILLGPLGLSNGLSRELPYEMGRGNDAYAGKLANSVFVVMTILGAIAASAFIIWGSVEAYHHHRDAAIVLFTYSVSAALVLMNKHFLPVLYRTNKDFKKESKINIAVSIANVVTVVMVWYWGLMGLCVRGIILIVFETSLLNYFKPYKLKFEWNKEDLKKLFKTGLPIFFVGQVNPQWTNIMNTLLFSFGGALNFGYFALCSITQATIGIIPNAFSQVLYPKMSRMYGEGKSLKTIYYSFRKAAYLQSVFIFGIAVIGTFIIPWVIPPLLPKYVNGIAAAQWMMFVPAVQSLSLMNNLFNVAKKQTWYFLSLIAGAIGGTIYILIRLKLGTFNLVFFPQGLIVGAIIQQGMCMFAINKLVHLPEFSNERAG